MEGKEIYQQTSGTRRREIANACPTVLRIEIDRRPGQASRASADPEPITTGISGCAKAVEQRHSKQTTRRMGPGVRRDDDDRRPRNESSARSKAATGAWRLNLPQKLPRPDDGKLVVARFQINRSIQRSNAADGE